MGRGVSVGLVAVGLMVAGQSAAACDGGGGGAGASTSLPVDRSSTATAARPKTTSTTVPTPTTTFAQSDTPPPLVNTGEDLDAIVRSFANYGEWLSVHPENPELLAEIIRIDSPAWNGVIEVFRRLSREGLRTTGDNPGSIEYTSIVARDTPDSALVLLHVLNPPFNIVDANGDIVQTENGSPLTAWVYELQRVDGRWRIESRTVIGRV